jgi:hypothetical protein
MRKFLSLVLGIVVGATFILSCSKEEFKSSEKEITEFSIGSLAANAKGIVDQKAKTVTFKVPAGTDVKALVPMVMVSKYATVVPASGVSQDFTAPVTYTVTAEDGSKQTFTVTVIVMSGDKEIKSFKFAGLTPAVVGGINKETGAIRLSVPFGTNVKELVPTIEISEKATVTPSAGVKQDFTKPVVYTVAAEDGSKREYTVTVEAGKSTEKQLLEFKLAGISPAVVATVDEGKKTVKAVVPFGTNVKALVPTLSVSANATVNPASGVATDFTSDVQYTVTAQDGSKQAYTVSVEVAKNAEAKILKFKFAGLNPAVEGVVNEAEKTVKLTVPYGTNVASIVPSVTYSANAAISPNSEVAQNFSNPVVYAVTSESGVKVNYTVSVEVAKFKPEIREVSSVGVAVGDLLTIKGLFVAQKTDVYLGDKKLQVESSTSSEMKVTIPSGIGVGSYSLSVVVDGAEVVYGTKINVVDPNAPVIISLNKTSFIRGLDEIVITGRNLKPKGWSSYLMFGNKGYAVDVKEDGTVVRFVVPREVAVGQVNVKVSTDPDNDVFSNTLSVSILENTNPVPVISKVNKTSIFIGDVLEITGSNFAKQGNKIRFQYPNSQMGINGVIISESETSIKVATDDLPEGESFNLMVSSNGQEAIYQTPIVVSKGITVVTSLTPSTVKAGGSIVLAGEYFYDNGFFLTVDGKYVDYTRNSLEKITVPISEYEDAGEHTLVLKTTDYVNPKTYTLKFTVVK